MTRLNNSLQNQSNPFESGMALPFPLSKGFITLFALLLLLVTLTGSSALLSSPIHPIGLVLGILLPAYLFLLFALIRQHSLFSALFLFLQKQLLKLQKQIEKSSAPQTAFNADPKALGLLTKVIMHSAWSIIFIGLLIGLFFQLTLKQYHFNLYSTLFPYSSNLYFTIINLFNFLPNLLFGELISADLIRSTLKGTPSASDNAIWARWILLMILIYGLLPRLLFLLVAYLKYQSYQKHCLYNHKQQAQTNIIDPAKTRPISERSPKTILKGVGDSAIALDFSLPLPTHIKIINDRTAFNALQERLKISPLAALTLYIDASLTPDRSLLRRIYTLLNCAVNNTIILVESGQHQRTNEWQHKLQPHLLENETIMIKPLSAINTE